MKPEGSHLSSFGRFAATVLVASQILGCEVDSWFNPAISGYWEMQPTTIPILDRIDAIEHEDDFWGQTTGVMSEDLIPSDLSYRMVPGDFVTVGILDLYAPGQWATSTRRIDAGGNIRVLELGDVPAAGYTPQEFEEALTQILLGNFITESPQVDVHVEEGSGFHYTVYGLVAAPGLYTLRNPDLRLMDAMAIVGGVARQAPKLYIIRQVELTDQTSPFDAGMRETPKASSITDA